MLRETWRFLSYEKQNKNIWLVGTKHGHLYRLATISPLYIQSAFVSLLMHAGIKEDIKTPENIPYATEICDYNDEESHLQYEWI